jgi:hypothetical protein
MRVNADVPEGHPPVFLPRLFDIWSQEYLKGDPHSRDRSPPSVKTPWGALTDVSELWGGGHLYDPADIKVPVSRGKATRQARRPSNSASVGQWPKWDMKSGSRR